MDTDGSVEDGDISAEDAFSLVANETRMAILLALWEADEPLAFSELRARVGTRDSGQFNYHLDKLVGRFVRKVEPKGEGDDRPGGYVLRYPGTQVIGSVYSGVFTETASIGPIDVDGDCWDCGGDLVATYEDERATVECRECETPITSFGVPPGILEGRDREALPRVFDDWVRGQLELVTRGFCPLCTGSIDGRLESEYPEAIDVDLTGIRFECGRCGMTVSSTVGTAFLSHPAVLAFHHDHGIDLTAIPLWDLDWVFEDHTEVRSRDPVDVDVLIDLDDERLTLHVGDGFEVRDTERTAI